MCRGPLPVPRRPLEASARTCSGCTRATSANLRITWRACSQGGRWSAVDDYGKPPKSPRTCTRKLRGHVRGHSAGDAFQSRSRTPKAGGRCDRLIDRGTSKSSYPGDRALLRASMRRIPPPSYGPTPPVAIRAGSASSLRQAMGGRLVAEIIRGVRAGRQGLYVTDPARLRTAIFLRGYSLGDFARLAGIAPSTLSRVLTGQSVAPQSWRAPIRTLDRT